MLAASRRRITNAVNLLEEAGVLTVTASGALVLVPADWSAGTVLTAAHEVTEARQRVDRSRVEMMRGYTETAGCRREFLLGYFGQAYTPPCGACDRCLAGDVVAGEEQMYDEVDGWHVAQRVGHTEWGPGVILSLERDRLTVLFDEVGYKTLSLAVVRAGRLLVPTPSDPGPAGSGPAGSGPAGPGPAGPGPEPTGDATT